MKNELELSKYIGEKIRYYRKMRNLTQEELGEKLGTGKSRISNYETGYRTPQQNDLFNLADALEISINDLFPPTQTKEISKTERIAASIKDATDEELEDIMNFIKTLKEKKSN